MSTENYSSEQKLIDIIFQMASVMHEHADFFKEKDKEDVMRWVAHQLEEYGFPTQPVGSSWGVLKKKR
jgi:hypothetical protein